MKFETKRHDVALCVLLWLAMSALKTFGIDYWYMLRDPAHGKQNEDLRTITEFSVVAERGVVSADGWCGTFGFTDTSSRGVIRHPHGDFSSYTDTEKNLTWMMQEGHLKPFVEYQVTDDIIEIRSQQIFTDRDIYNITNQLDYFARRNSLHLQEKDIHTRPDDW